MQADAPVLRAEERRAALAALASAITRGYVVPEGGERMVAALQAAATTDPYAEVTDPRVFAKRLTDDLRGISRDKHVTVYYHPEMPPGPSPAAAAGLVRERYNYGVARVGRLRGNVGLLELQGFSGDERARPVVSAAMAVLRNTDAIIVDVRENGGGNTGGAVFTAGFFLPTRTHFTDIWYRDTNETGQFWTTAPDAEHMLAQPIYVLTSPRTFSAAEDFCYGLQALKRATLVGEVTGGGAHSGRGLIRLSRSFEAFVPVGRSVNPVTKSNWEGTGVTPDIRVPAATALTEAHIVALERLLAAESDPGWKQELTKTIADSRTGAPGR